MESRALSTLEFFKVLNYLASFAVSEAGKKACLNLRPFPSLEEVRASAVFFEEGRVWLSRTKLLPSSLPSLELFLQQFEVSSSLLDMDAFFALRQVLVESDATFKDILSEQGDVLWPSLFNRCKAIQFPAKTVSALTRCISDEGLIKDSASPELSVVRSEIRRLHRHCTKKVKEYAAEYNIMHYLQDDYMTLSSDRYVLPLKTNFKGKLQGVVHDYSQTGETCYFEPLFLIEVNNRLQALKREEREEEHKIFVLISSIIREELVSIQAVSEMLTDLDVLQAKSTLADIYTGRIVDFSEQSGVFLADAFHPLLLLASSAGASKKLAVFLAQQESEILSQHFFSNSFVKNELGEGIISSSSKDLVPSTIELRPGERALVISGGNAGGKTVCLKTLGLIALMSKSALPVPVGAGSVLPFWQHIHAFIGDEQSLEDHVSTFTAQITNLARIWPELGPDELVILDEFGAGTDPTQGAALAQAVLDRITAHGAYVLAATHFPALKAYALSTEGVRAASVLFDPQTKRPLYRLVYEQVGASLALDVAREHGLPAEVLERAEHYLLMSGEDTSSLIARLNDLAVAREAEIDELQKQQYAFEEQKKQLVSKLNNDRDKLSASIQEDVRFIMGEWKAGKLSHKQALKELAHVRHDLSQTESTNFKKSGDPLDFSALTIGQTLTHAVWNRPGIIQELDEKKKRVRLNMDGVSLWAKIDDLRPCVTDTNSAVKKVSNPVNFIQKNGANTFLHLDVRGKRADVAISETLKFIDDAIIEGKHTIELVHGRGTGVLRRELHELLKRTPVVKSFRLAPEDQGGDGMTIVELK